MRNMLAEENTKKYLEKINAENDGVRAFLHINENALSEARAIDDKVSKGGKRGRLYGKVIGVKSNINVKGLIANCASKVLENYVSTYDATVISKIKDEDGVIIGMLNMDEFACGSGGEHSAYGTALNPVAPDRVPGGSSSGSASAVAAGFCDIALGSDTGGSIRCPASNCGVVGVKPSYGLVSRYGLIDLSMSLDQIGPIAKNVDDCALMLDIISGKDEKDTKTFDTGKIEISDVKKIKIGVLKIKGVDKNIQSLIDKRIKEVCEKYKWDNKDIDIKHVDLAVQTYYPLVYAEFFSGTRRFDGRRYGYKIEDKCGAEVLRRIIGGSEITKAEHAGQYYRKALEVKEIIKKEFEKVFEKYDCVMLPSVPKLPWKVGEKLGPEDEYAFDACTIPANLAGICAISLPAGKVDDVPIGMQIMCAKGQESKMLGIAKMSENN
jgi:aspartyl-tRNA(Asn)/glutamyl-tRNA(Gln) amidotransferase subunit A